jgi:hypothetical protein
MSAFPSSPERGWRGPQGNTTDPPVREKRDGVSLIWYAYPLASFRYGPIVTLRDSGHLLGNGGRGYSWTVEEKPFPKIFVSVEKFPLRAGGFVDVVEFIVGPEMDAVETAGEAAMGVATLSVRVMGVRPAETGRGNSLLRTLRR